MGAGEQYVYDRAADTLTLPNATGRVLQGGEQVRSVEAGLPNITGDVTGTDDGLDGYTTSACYVSQKGLNINWDSSRGDYKGGVQISFDASRSSPIYGRSETVQPSALTMIAQIKY